MLFVAAIILLFISKLRFPASKSIASVLRQRSGNEVLQTFRHHERQSKKAAKCMLDINFLNLCEKNNLVPKFLNFKLANRSLQNTPTYKQCHYARLVGDSGGHL